MFKPKISKNILIIACATLAATTSFGMNPHIKKTMVTVEPLIGEVEFLVTQQIPSTFMADIIKNNNSQTIGTKQDDTVEVLCIATKHPTYSLFKRDSRTRKNSKMFYLYDLKNKKLIFSRRLDTPHDRKFTIQCIDLIKSNNELCFIDNPPSAQILVYASDFKLWACFAYTPLRNFLHQPINTFKNYAETITGAHNKIRQIEKRFTSKETFDHFYTIIKQDYEQSNNRHNNQNNQNDQTQNNFSGFCDSKDKKFKIFAEGTQVYIIDKYEYKDKIRDNTKYRDTTINCKSY